MTYPTTPRHPSPPFTPTLFVGLAARPVPEFVFQPLLDVALQRILLRHPDVFERMSGLDTPVFLIDPVDLPWRIMLHADALRPTMRLIGADRDVPHAAMIRGSAAALLSLLEGTCDGDALFFSRELIIDGDTEAVVALRNALDNAEIDLFEDIVTAFGPLATPLRIVMDRMRRNLAHVSAVLSLIHDALNGQTWRHLELQQHEIAALHGRLDDLKMGARRIRPARRTS